MTAKTKTGTQKEAAPGMGTEEKSPVPRTLQGQDINSIADILDMFKPMIAQALPQQVSPNRIMQVVTTVVSQNPDLKKCTVPSLLGAIMESAILGLDPTPALGHCAFIPRRNKKSGDIEAQFMIQYQGYIQLARRSGEVKNVRAHVVYANDHFDVEYGLQPKLEHKPKLDGDRGERKLVYAVWDFGDGNNYFDVLTKDDVERAKKSSQAAAAGQSPWTTDVDAMWKKTAVRATRKYVPMSVEGQQAFAADQSVISAESFKSGGELDLSQIQTEEAEELEGQYTEAEPQEAGTAGDTPRDKAKGGGAQSGTTATEKTSQASSKDKQRAPEGKTDESELTRFREWLGRAGISEDEACAQAGASRLDSFAGDFSKLKTDLRKLYDVTVD